MGLLTSIGAIDAALRGATGLVRELRKPKQSAFQPVLQQQIQESTNGLDQNATRAQIEQRATELGTRYMRARDANGDGVLSAAESGMNAEAFARYDVDKDGRLSMDELRTPFANQLSQNLQGPENG